MIDIRRIFDWLVDGAPGATNAAQVVGRVSEELAAAGIPLDRAAAYVCTLHPHIRGRSFLWRRGDEVQIIEAPYEYFHSPEFLNSPVAAVFRTGQLLRRRLTDADSPHDFPILDELAADGVTDYLVGPLRFLSGEVHAVTFATRDPDGFTADHIAAFTDLLRPLARIAEILALSRTAVNLLNTYVGRDAGERIIAGKIHLGDTETIRAALWCSDLRGFTALAGAVEPPTLIRTLNDLFECQVSAIQRHGGEVLKFIGDGLLAIFPVHDASPTPPGLCAAALDAAGDAFEAVRALNRVRITRGEPSLRLGLALHFGDVSYGNIGGASRLDFTCIGPAVNLVSRLEGLTGRLGRPLVVSSAFAELAQRPMTALGTFELKGVAEPQAVFGPSEGQPLAAW
ncbi:MAG TPA: adenylate/guanylate cyclase domain-containing protein [Polyangia bacterium]|jgi:adenylate cyclase|nr:adenylate/guanylate cyclase domain-containing protein [Polyangia bacterium]